MRDKKAYLIENIGCDDTTYAILELTETEYEFLTKVFEEINKNSSYYCQPKIKFNLEDKVELVNGDYEDEFDYRKKTNDYDSDTKKINGKIYKFIY